MRARIVMGGVQSVPRVMRGAPVVRPVMWDVPLAARGLSGLDSQGLARTLADIDIEMPEECMRPGEVLIAPGVCGPDTRRPVDPYASAPPVAPIPISTTVVKPRVATSASSAIAGMSRTTLLFAAVGAVGLIYYLGKRR